MQKNEFEPSALFGGFPEPVFLLREGTVIYCNPAAERMFPPRMDYTMLPPELYDLLSPGEDDFLAAVPLRGQSWRLSRQSTPWGPLVMLRPLTDGPTVPRPELVALRLRQQTAGLAAALQRLGSDPASLDAKSYASYLAIANQGLHRLLRLCDQLDFLEREDSQLYRPGALDLAGLCRALSRELESMASAAGFRFQYESELSSLPMTGDEALLRKLLLSLLSNAMKALGQSGELGLRLARQGDRALITVWDRGEGLDEEHLSTLFGGGSDPGRPGTGLGLGLETVRRIASLHGGAVMVETRDGDGLRCVVSLPIRMDPGAPLRTPATHYDSSGGFSPLLIEFSDFLPAELYTPEDLD